MAFPLESSIHCDPGPQGEGLQGSGFSTRATFVTVGQSEPYSLQGLVFEFSISGRR